MVSCHYRDRRNEIGWAVLVLVGAGFAYLTLLVVVVPLLEEEASAFVDTLFPTDRFDVLRGITVVGVALASVVVTSLGIVCLDNGLRRD